MKKNIDPNLIADVKKVASKLNTNKLSKTEYFQHGLYTSNQVYDGGQTWEDVCYAAGLKTKKKEPISDEKYFNQLKQAFKLLGRYPKTSERKKFKLNFSKKRYPTLNDFIRKAVSLNYVPDLLNDKNEKTNNDTTLTILDLKSSQKESLDNLRSIPAIPIKTKRKSWERIDVEGFSYAPHDELGTVGLFAILCSKRIIQWQILEMRGGKGIDVTYYDEINNKQIRVELKHILSKANWNHNIDDLDYVVCWENRWSDFPKPVIVLKEIVKIK